MNIDERAALLEMKLADYVALGKVDARLVAEISIQEPGARERLWRWIRAGLPAPDYSRLEFEGSDGVRAVVLETLARTPSAVAWHVCEYVVICEVGRDTTAWSGVTPIVRAPDGDQAHIIVINGNTPDDELHGIIAHEIGHSWTRVILPRMRTAALPPAQAFYSDKLAAGITRADLIRARLAEEKLADDLAALWGSPINRTHVTDPAVALRRQLAATNAGGK